MNFQLIHVIYLHTLYKQVLNERFDTFGNI